mmetsp:Transcript_17980/g.56345  ORF Transcript_17980/g.56345 Transcript_17980/m.56345 type:complete len:360 (-) Transcript_17980:38-1117(-)
MHVTAVALGRGPRLTAASVLALVPLLPLAGAHPPVLLRGTHGSVATATQLGAPEAAAVGPALVPGQGEDAHEAAALAAEAAATGLSLQGKAEAPARLDAIFRSVLAGLSTSLGAGIVLLLRGAPTPSQMAFALALAGSVMITVSLVELWLPQLAQPGRRLECVAGAFAGLLGFLALKSLVPEPELGPHAKACEDLDDCERGRDSRQAHKAKQWRLAVLLTLALTAHNFPEGLAVAVSSLQSERLGFVVMAAIAVHNIPEGIAIAMPVLDATGSRTRAMQLATLSGLAEPLGAILAVTLLPEYFIKGRGMDILLCAVGGIMTCVACTELLPEAQVQRKPICMLGGLICGASVMLLTHELA